MTAKTLNFTQTADRIGVKRRTLYNMIGDGRFPVRAIKGSKPPRWNIEEIDAWRFKK